MPIVAPTTLALVAVLLCACSDPGEKGGPRTEPPDAGNDSAVDDGVEPLNNVSNQEDPFVMRGVTLSGTEQGERVVFRAFGSNIACASMPTMSLGAAEEQTVTAVDCDDEGFVLDFVPTVPPAVYELIFINGDGSGVSRPHDLTFTVYERSGMLQAPIAQGRRPSLATNEEASAGVVAAIDPADSTVFFLPRSRDFATPFLETEPDRRYETTVVANEVHVEPTGDAEPAYIAVWAGDEELGAVWLDSSGAPMADAPPPLSTDGPHQVDLLHDRGDRMSAMVWRRSDGNLEVGIIGTGELEWVIGPTHFGTGDWPRITLGAPEDYTVTWSVERSESYTLPISNGPTRPGPVGEPELMQFNRANCDYSPASRGFWVCEDFSADDTRLLAYNGEGFFTPQHAADQLAYPPGIETDVEGDFRSTLFLAYADTLGGMTYAVYDFRVFDAPERLFGRHARPANPDVPPDLSVSVDSSGESFAWVTEIDQMVELGSMSK